jgi:hypothetical protein
MWQPWVGHWYPGLTPERMIELSLTGYVAMHDYVQEMQKSREPR